MWFVGVLTDDGACLFSEVTLYGLKVCCLMTVFVRFEVTLFGLKVC